MAGVSRLPPLHLLRTFEAAARHLSFTKAAQELHVTPAAVSQQIKALEAALGVPLFQRLTRALRLTDAGAAMLPRLSEGLACLAAAVAQARAPAQLLKLAAPPSFASHWLVPRLDGFFGAHPGIELRLSSGPDAVDRGGEPAALEPLRAHAEDAAAHLAILYGSGPYPGWRVDRLFTPRYLPVCAPALAPVLRAPADLCRATLIHDDTLAEGAGPLGFGWAQWLAAAGVRCPGGTPQRHFSNAVLAIEAALAGQGVALAARALVAPQLASGTLVAPFSLALDSPFAYSLVSAERVAARPAVAALREWLLRQAAAEAA